MSAVLKGAGVVWSVGALTFTGGIASGTNAGYVQSTNCSRTADKVNIKSNGGIVQGQVFSGFMRTARITVIPYHDTTVSGAETSFDAWAPKPGTTVTIADGGGTTLLVAAWNVISSSQARTVAGEGAVDLELETSDESVDITTAVS